MLLRVRGPRRDLLGLLVGAELGEIVRARALVVNGPAVPACKIGSIEERRRATCGFAILELECRLAGDGRALEARAPVALDVLHDAIGAGEVRAARRPFRVKHRVGHVAHQCDVLAEPHQLANAERPAQHAHV